VLREVAEIVTPIAVAADACRDADDLPVLGTVLAAKADCLVTGDKDLLVLTPFSGHPILSPRQFWQRLK
jgi:putative PIN family toxin of toxin-antitoxin system